MARPSVPATVSVLPLVEIGPLLPVKPERADDRGRSLRQLDVVVVEVLVRNDDESRSEPRERVAALFVVRIDEDRGSRSFQQEHGVPEICQLHPRSLPGSPSMSH